MRFKRNHKFAYLLASIALLLFIFPFLEQTSIGRHSFNVLLVLILFTGIRAVCDTKKKLYVAIAISIPTIVFQIARYATTSELVYYIGQFLMLIFFVFATVLLFEHILETKEVTHDEILGAISIYLMIALVFTSLFLIVDMMVPKSFEKTGQSAAQRMVYSDYLYYSFGTITTAGSGDIVEIGPFVRSLSMFEAIIGVFYVAFIISKLVPRSKR